MAFPAERTRNNKPRLFTDPLASSRTIFCSNTRRCRTRNPRPRTNARPFAAFDTAILTSISSGFATPLRIPCNIGASWKLNRQSLPDRPPHSPLYPCESGLQPLALKHAPNCGLNLGGFSKPRQKSIRSHLGKALPIYCACSLQYRPPCIKTQNRIPYPCFFENTPPTICLSQATMMP